MGLFNFFGGKQAEPVVKVEPVPDLENAQGVKVGNPDVAEISRWSKFVGGVRKVTSDAKLKIFGVDQEAIKAKQDRVERGKVFIASQHAPEAPLEKLYSADFNVQAPVTKPAETFVAKSEDQLRAESLEESQREALREKYSTTSSEELESLLALKVQEEKSILFNKMDPAIYPTKKDREDLTKRKGIELDEIRAELKKRDEPQVVVEPEIKVVNTDAVSVTNVEVKKESPANAFIAGFKARTLDAKKFLTENSCKVMDAHGKLSLKQKMALSVATLGAGFVTGGTSIAFSRTFTAASAIKKMIDKETIKIKQGVVRELDTKEKRMVLLKAAAVGTFIGLAGQGIFDILSTLHDVAGDEVASIISPEEVSSAVEAVAQVEPPKELVTEIKSVMDGADNPIQTDPGMIVDIPTAYEFVQGDNLGQVLLDKVFGDSELTPKERFTEIYNMFTSTEGKALLAESGITNVDDIKAGSKINLQKFADLLN